MTAYQQSLIDVTLEGRKTASIESLCVVHRNCFVLSYPKRLRNEGLSKSYPFAFTHKKNHSLATININNRSINSFQCKEECPLVPLHV